jgi:hypothetical protein
LQSLLPTPLAKVPAAQSSHAVDPASSLNLPASQLRQSALSSWFDASVPASSLYLPAAQGRQAPCWASTT